MSKIITVLIILFNLYLSYRFGIKKEGLDFVAGFKNINTTSGRKYVGDVIAIYLLIVDVILLLCFILDVIGIRKIYNIGIWDIYFYILIIVTIFSILIINLCLK